MPIATSTRPATPRPVPPRPASLAAALSALLVLAAPACAQNTRTFGDDPGLAHLADEVARLAEHAEGTVGVAAYHLETGRGITLNGDERFPMASTYKVPIAVQILTMIDKGEVSLQDLVELERRDVYVTSGAISDLLDDPGLQISIHNLLELMLQISDNIATDILMRQAGGSAAVTARMAEAGVDGIRVDRPTWALIANWLGDPDVSEDNQIDPADYRKVLEAERTDESMAANNAAFNADPRDTATPAAMSELLQKIWNREVLSEESSALLIDIMYRCQTGVGAAEGRAAAGDAGRAQDGHDRADHQRRGHHRPAGRRGPCGDGRLHQGVGDRKLGGPGAGDRPDCPRGPRLLRLQPWLTGLAGCWS